MSPSFDVSLRAAVPLKRAAQIACDDDPRTIGFDVGPGSAAERTSVVRVDGVEDAGRASAKAIEDVREVLGGLLTGAIWVEQTVLVEGAS